MTSVGTTLTTVFAPPSSCFGLTSVSSYSELWLGFGTACKPGPEASNGYFSPGICPSGYTNACPLERSSLYNSVSVTEIVLGPGELGHRCCPIGYACLTSDWFPYLCRGTFSAPTTVPYWESGRFASVYTVAEPIAGTTANAYAVCVKWKKDDLTLFPPQVAATLETSEPLPPTTSGTRVTTRPASAPPTATATGASGLPRSTRIVVGVLVPLALICVLVALFFYFRRRHWNQPVDTDPGHQLHLDDMPRPTHEGKGFGDISQTPTYRVQSPGNELSLPILPSGADLSMGQEPWQPSAEMPVPENPQGSGNLDSGYLRKLRGSGY